MKRNYRIAAIAVALACLGVAMSATAAFATTTGSLNVVTLNSSKPSTTFTKWVAPGDTCSIDMQALMAPMTLVVKDAETGEVLLNRTVQPVQAIGPTRIFTYTQPLYIPNTSKPGVPRKLTATMKLPVGVTQSSVSSIQFWSNVTVKPFEIPNTSIVPLDIEVGSGQTLALHVTSDARYLVDLRNTVTGAGLFCQTISVPTVDYHTMNNIWKNSSATSASTCLTLQTYAASNLSGEALIY